MQDVQSPQFSDGVFWVPRIEEVLSFQEMDRVWLLIGDKLIQTTAKACKMFVRDVKGGRALGFNGETSRQIVLEGLELAALEVIQKGWFLVDVKVG